MAGDNGKPPAEDRLLRRFRVVSVATILVLIAFVVIVDTLGRLLVRPDFHVGDIFLGTLVGALLLLLGVETISRLPGFPGGGK